jgi:hypothetical protein
MHRTFFMMSLCVVLLSACMSNERQILVPFQEVMPPGTQIDLRGIFTFSSSGELSLTLAYPCTVTVSRIARGPNDITVVEKCDRDRLDATELVAQTPWHTTIHGKWIDAHRIVFPIDWKNIGLDPLADDAVKLAGQPWTISTTVWRPTQEQAEQILKLISEATQTEIDVVHGGAAPALAVTAFEFSKGILRAGKAATLTVRIQNAGHGNAYRVVAVTRSAVVSLHGLRLSFGLLKPGDEKARTLHLRVPLSEPSSDAMFVLVLKEGNGFAPPYVSQRVKILEAETFPILHVHCAIAGRATAQPDLDAGELIVLHCVVENTGTIAAKAELFVAIGGGGVIRMPAQPISVGGYGTFDVPLTIPRDLAIDSSVKIAVAARDNVFIRTSRTTIIGTIRKPRLCAAGQLTRDQYESKIAELRAAAVARDITQAELDRYEAELVACMP